ncbi:hypothetical protein C530_150 [Candidatus Portiera aleyrodidarum BT-B-HRs]|nr:hypothetical protein C548_148 [Candidatus Portiera aleyrodidarum BT-QVLC]AFT80794.1 hypothetical protein C530_150 [Candidatus Portiera aleyrodidarum BT-B-HRs]
MFNKICSFVYFLKNLYYVICGEVSYAILCLNFVMYLNRLQVL